MGDVCPRNAEDPWVPLEVATLELRQLTVVVRRQVVADLPKLLLDDVKVVDKPFRCRRDRSFFLDRVGQDTVGLEQDPAVLGGPSPDRAPDTRPRGDRLGGGKRLAVLLQALDAEELSDDWILGVRFSADQAWNADEPLPVRLETLTGEIAQLGTGPGTSRLASIGTSRS